MVWRGTVVMEGCSGDEGGAVVMKGVQCMFWGVVTKFVHANCILTYYNTTTLHIHLHHIQLNY